MQWDKAKSILIIFFLIINIALFGYVVADGINGERIENTVNKNAIELLMSKNIKVDEKLTKSISKERKIKNAYVKNIITNYRDFSKALIGDELNMLDENVYGSDIGTVRFRGDNFYADAKGGRSLFEFSDNKADLSKNAENYLKTLGFNINKDTFVKEKSNGDSKILFFKNTINGKEVFDSGISITVSDNKVISVSGCWYNETNRNPSVIELKGISSILIDYMNQKENDSACAIGDMRLGYSTLDTEVYHESVVLTPVWAVTDYMGNVKYINARENI